MKFTCSETSLLYRESCICSGPFEGNMEIKPKEIEIWASTVNGKTIILLVHYILFW